MKQLSGESTNKYRVRMEDEVRILERLGLDVPSQQQQAMRFLFSLDPVKHADMITDLKNDALKIPNTTYPADLVSMCDLARNRSSKSSSSKNRAPAYGVVFTTTAEGDNRKAGDKGQKKNVNVKVKDAKPDRK